MPLYPCFMTPEYIHEFCVICLGAEHSRSALEGAGYTHCDKFSVIKLHSHLALFLRDEGQVSAPCSSGPAAAEALLPALVMCWIQKMDHLDLHSEVEKSWKNPYLAHIFPFQHSNYMNVEGLYERGYVKIPPVEGW